MKAFIPIFLLSLPLFGYGQIITTIIGTGTPGYSGDGGPANNAKLNQPCSVKIDGWGNIYIADKKNHVIRKINASGIITTIAGNGYGAGTLSGGYSGDGGPATNAKLSNPTDIAIDNAGNLYIAEFGNKVIRRVSSDGIISTIAGTGEAGYSGDGGPATAAKIYDPLGLVFDNEGNLYFSNNGSNVVRKISTSGTISTVAGTGASGFNGDGGPATAAQLKLTAFLAFNQSGELHIPDYLNHRIRKIDASNIISTVVGNGSVTNTGDGGVATNAGLLMPTSVVFDFLGNMYISDADAGVIRKVNSGGIISTIAGTDTAGYGGDNGPASTAQLGREMNCSVTDNWGNLYVADLNNHRIRKIIFNVNVEGISNDIKATIYPNPATTHITLTSTEPISHIAIINTLGQQLVQTISNKTQTTIPINHLPPGSYIIKINNRYAGRFVKQ